MATMDDVAKRAGVSLSTVSYVISGRRPISEPTKRRVLRAMKELRFTPNAVARGLAGARLGIIALHYPYSAQGVSSTENEYVSSAAERARDKGFHLLLWTQGADDLDGLRSLVDQGLVDGVILMEVTPEDARIAALKESGRPFVLVGQPNDAEGVAFVDNDYEEQARQAIAYLKELGHTRAVFLCQDVGEGDRGFAPSLHMRRELGRAARHQGIALGIRSVPPTPRGGREALVDLLGQHPRPTAVLAFNEVAVAGLANSAASMGVTVPNDLTIVALSMGAVHAEVMMPP
ncbi:LacI family DNA-binding transcriptional regulator [Tessaracoccus caeni]|uniref:LacI family DNA-binding transcriptional regulator n=1 Tax=Tessaracoccus caeni TaxID=3031239 RepID=UPI0023DAE518|nr:LacI family DNA-binding transcriptional regulator [Tessaracoccus caeni]MDF1487999.1 LacI family DNA-binding transcriptional regulator [Tessaracoccus caeni]